MSNVLIIASHPDDEILGCGIAIQKHIKSDDRVRILILTNGGDSRYNKEKTKTNVETCKKVCKKLGVDVTFGNFPDQGLDNIPLINITRRIEAEIKSHNPEIVYTHHFGDLNKDHRIVHEATITACRPIFGSCVKRLLSYWVQSSSEWNKYSNNTAFIPNWIISATNEEVEIKTNMMKMYANEDRQFPHPRSTGGIKNSAQNWGIKFGYRWAEPFQLMYNIT